MVKWPTTGRDVPKDLGDHAARLKAEFDSVNSAVNASLLRNDLIPSALESKIEKGIANGLAEARANGYCPKWSEIDKIIFSNVLLKNITTATALKARDRIPLPQFHGLHESFEELYVKIQPQSSTTSQTRPAAAAPVATQPTPAVNPISAAPKNKTASKDNTAPGPIRAPNRSAPARQGEKAKLVSSENTNSHARSENGEGKEGESEGYVDVSDGHEGIGNENTEMGEKWSKGGTDNNDVGLDSEDMARTDSNSDIEQGVSNIVRDGKGFKTNFILNIEQQATVNRLEGMTADELSACLSSSLKKYLHKQELSSRSVQIANQILLDDGHVNLNLQAKTHEALQQLTTSGNWSWDFERRVCPPNVTTCKVRVHKVVIDTVRLQSRKEKAATIRILAIANHESRTEDQVTRVGPIIRDIHWPSKSSQKKSTSLTVEFLDPEDANCVLRRGLYWEGRRHGCEREGKKFKLRRCNNCQAYGHSDTKCRATHRCGKCAGYHSTASCKSRTVKCSSCGHAHVAGSNGCPAKLEARRRLEFPTKPSPQAMKPAAEAQGTPSPHVRHSTSVARTQIGTFMPSPVSLDAADEKTESESEHLLREANPSPDIQPGYASIKRELDDLRRMVTALHPEAPSRTKRQADEAFAGGADAESSYKGAIPMKRIKKEQPSREGSMGLYRQPSPFIVNRDQ